MSTFGYKAFSFGVLNTSNATRSRLVVTAVLPPSVHPQKRLKCPDFLGYPQQNEARFAELQEQFVIRRIFACGRLRLGVPEKILFQLGPKVRVTLGEPSHPSCPAGMLMSKMGALHPRAIPLVKERSTEITTEDAGGVVAMELEKAEMQLVTFTVPLQTETVFALDVRHVEEGGAPIGNISLFFTPEVELR